MVLVKISKKRQEMDILIRDILIATVICSSKLDEVQVQQVT